MSVIRLAIGMVPVTFLAMAFFDFNIYSLGFALAIFGAGESDPGPAIWLVPVAALTLLYALSGIARTIH